MSTSSDRSRRVTKDDYVALAEFRLALRTFLNFSGEAARAAGLSPQQHQALLAIKGFAERDSVTIGELAAKLFLRHHSAVGLVDRLVKKRLLKRSPDPEDRRKVHVSLTSQGEALIDQLSSVHRNELRRIGPELRRRLETLSERD
jgi:DNA-binding MarR family transcriptional regulator